MAPSATKQILILACAVTACPRNDRSAEDFPSEISVSESKDAVNSPIFIHNRQAPAIYRDAERRSWHIIREGKCPIRSCMNVRESPSRKNQVAKKLELRIDAPGFIGNARGPIAGATNTPVSGNR